MTQMVKNLPASGGDAGSIPKSQTQLRDSTTTKKRTLIVFF